MMLSFGINTHIECMKKENNPHNRPRLILSPAELEQAQQKVYYLMNGLNQTLIQLDYIKAMQERNVQQLYSNLMQGRPEKLLLDFAIESRFDAGVVIILKCGKPTQLELNRALDIAAQIQNAPLITLLIHCGASVSSCMFKIN